MESLNEFKDTYQIIPAKVFEIKQPTCLVSTTIYQFIAAIYNHNNY